MSNISNTNNNKNNENKNNKVESLDDTPDKPRKDEFLELCNAKGKTREDFLFKIDRVMAMRVSKFINATYEDYTEKEIPEDQRVICVEFEKPFVQVISDYIAHLVERRVEQLKKRDELEKQLKEKEAQLKESSCKFEGRKTELKNEWIEDNEEFEKVTREGGEQEDKMLKLLREEVASLTGKVKDLKVNVGNVELVFPLEIPKPKSPIQTGILEDALGKYDPWVTEYMNKLDFETSWGAYCCANYFEMIRLEEILSVRVATFFKNRSQKQILELTGMKDDMKPFLAKEPDSYGHYHFNPALTVNVTERVKEEKDDNDNNNNNNNNNNNGQKKNKRVKKERLFIEVLDECMNWLVDMSKINKPQFVKKDEKKQNKENKNNNNNNNSEMEVDELD